MEFFYKILNYFDKCDHQYELQSIEMIQHQDKLVSKETYVCTKCKNEHRKYYIQNAIFPNKEV
jgi:hypothetical protein